MTKPAEKKWFAVELRVEPETVEAAEFAFNQLDALGTEIDYMRKSANGVCVVGYFDQMPDDEILQNELHYALRIYDLDKNAILSVEQRAVKDEDWLAEWKRHWKPTTVGRFVIAPPWETVDDAEKIVIRIEPNMAFGTGTHETTQLCLAAIEKYYQPGDSFLDVGTGTGILAIATARTTGRNTSGSECAICGYDTDSEAIEIARENAKLNNVATLIHFVEGVITSATPPFDFVCANLTLDVILTILPLLAAKTKKTLILSGILREQEEAIVSELKKLQFSDFEIERAGEWICVIVQTRVS